MWYWSEQPLVLLCFLCMGEEIGKDSMKPHPEGGEEPMHIQALLQLWVPHVLGWEPRGLLNKRLFFGKPLGVHGLYIGTSANDRSVRGQFRSKASSLLAELPGNAPGNGAVLPRAIGVPGRPMWALRICWEVQSPIRICWELVGLSPQVLYNHWRYTWWRDAAGARGSSRAKPTRFTRAWLRSRQDHKLPLLITLTPWTSHLMSVFCLSRIQRKSHTSLNGWVDAQSSWDVLPWSICFCLLLRVSKREQAGKWWTYSSLEGLSVCPLLFQINVKDPGKEKICSFKISDVHWSSSVCVGGIFIN